MKRTVLPSIHSRPETSVPEEGKSNHRRSSIISSNCCKTKKDNNERGNGDHGRYCSRSMSKKNKWFQNNQKSCNVSSKRPMTSPCNMINCSNRRRERSTHYRGSIQKQNRRLSRKENNFRVINKNVSNGSSQQSIEKKQQQRNNNCKKSQNNTRGVCHVEGLKKNSVSDEEAEQIQCNDVTHKIVFHENTEVKCNNNKELERAYAYSLNRIMRSAFERHMSKFVFV